MHVCHKMLKYVTFLRVYFGICTYNYCMATAKYYGSFLIAANSSVKKTFSSICPPKKVTSSSFSHWVHIAKHCPSLEYNGNWPRCGLNHSLSPESRELNGDHLNGWLMREENCRKSDFISFGENEILDADQKIKAVVYSLRKWFLYAWKLNFK